MNITNYKTGFTIAPSILTNQMAVTIVTYLSTTSSTILASFVTNDEINYDFLKDGLYEFSQIIFSTIVTPTGYYIANNKVYLNTVLVPDMVTLLDNTAITKDSVKIVVINDIETCYSNLIKKVLSNKLSKICDITHHEEEIKDILQMAITAIKYASELGLIYQAQRIVESIISSCDICGTINIENCGCNA